jgi:hypothetical protein
VECLCKFNKKKMKTNTREKSLSVDPMKCPSQNHLPL